MKNYIKSDIVMGVGKISEALSFIDSHFLFLPKTYLGI